MHYRIPCACYKPVLRCFRFLLASGSLFNDAGKITDIIQRRLPLKGVNEMCHAFRIRRLSSMLMCITVYITTLSFVLSDWGKPQNKETVNMATVTFLTQVNFS
jgi:hypothetical protein